MAEQPSIVVVGSVNLDIVATADRLPIAGETVTGATLDRFPGGKGANQALAAKRLGADVTLIACIGDDAVADEALALLRDDGVDLGVAVTHPTTPTGIALIAVSADGENQIIVAPGANRELSVAHLELPTADALIGQLEVPVETLVAAARDFDGLFCVNLAPAMEVPDDLILEANLIVVNELESDFYGDRLGSATGMVVRTFGADGAEMRRHGEVIARAGAPKIEAIDTTGAGDTFTAALTVALVENQSEEQALQFACAAGAAAATKAGAQPSLPTRSEVEKLMT